MGRGMLGALHEKPLLLFDWSGTLSNDRHYVYEANMRLLERHGVPRVGLERWRRDADWSASSRLASMFGKQPGDFYPAYSEILNTILAGRLPELLPGALDLVEALADQGKRIGVISSHPQGNLQQEIIGHGIERFVEVAAGSVTDKTITIRETCDRLNIQPDRAVFSGDTVQDIRSARIAGVLAVAYAGVGCYHPREMLEKQHPDVIVDSHTQLRELAVA